MSSESWSLPGYRIGQVLGRGGFATVYEAEQERLHRTVAVKVLSVDLATEADRRRFDRERDVLTRLGEHPHVVDLYDAGVSGGRPFLVMRLYRRGTLADLLGEIGPLPVAEVIALVGKLASALDAAHLLGVLHRDIKPENVLLTEGSEPVLADFGIAAVVDPDGSVSRAQASTAFFTVSHSAPEVLERAAFSVASDVYALASTAYMLLAGGPAFDSGNPRVMSQILDDPVPAIERADLPGPVLDAVLAGMAKDPVQRPASAGAFAQALLAAAATVEDRADGQTTKAFPRALPGLIAPAPIPAAAAVVSAAGVGPAAPYLPVVPAVRMAPAVPGAPGVAGPVPAVAPVPVHPGRRVATVAAAVVAIVIPIAVGGVWVLAARGDDSTSISDPAGSITISPVSGLTTMSSEAKALAGSPGSPAITGGPGQATSSHPVKVAPRATRVRTAPAVTVTSTPSVTAAASPVVTPPPTDPMPTGTYPVCRSATFTVTYSTGKTAKKTNMVLRTCVEQVAVHSYRAALTLHEVDLTVDDQVGASYTVELRRCGTGELVKTRSGDGGGLTQITANTAGTASSSGLRVYAVGRVGTTTLKVKGGKVFSGPGKTVTATSTCG